MFITGPPISNKLPLLLLHSAQPDQHFIFVLFFLIFNFFAQILSVNEILINFFFLIFFFLNLKLESEDGQAD